MGINTKFDKNVNNEWAHKQVENWFKKKVEDDCCDFKKKF